MNPKELLTTQLVASPCCLPAAPLDDLLAAYRALGFSKWEGFTEWAAARFDWKRDPLALRQKMETAGFIVSSFHLPPITAAAPEQSYEDALQAARFASALGCGMVVLKAGNRALLGTYSQRFMDQVQQENLPVVTLVQNHLGSAISTLEDYREVWQLVNEDPRLKAVLEVGQFARAGVPWQVAWEALGDRVALIHLNDVKARQSVPYGHGDVDFAGLLKHVKAVGYRGDIVVELELPSRRSETDETLAELQNALALLRKFYRSA